MAGCAQEYTSRTNPDYVQALGAARIALGLGASEDPLDFLEDTCTVDPIVPNATYFDQVHLDTGYASDNPDVQSNHTGMDEAAALLANRTDCEYDSELNFDALLLGGYFCHVCLPEQYLTCDNGGTCTNVQWSGYMCDNEYTIIEKNLLLSNGTKIDAFDTVLKMGVTYRFNNPSTDMICVSGMKQEEQVSSTCRQKGPILFTVDPTFEQARIYSEKDILMHLPISRSSVNEDPIQTYQDPDNNTNESISKTNENNFSIGAIVGVSLLLGAFVLIIVFGFLKIQQEKRKIVQFSTDEVPVVVRDSYSD